MRDDLHHSVAQTVPWRAVVRVACNEGSDDDVADELRRTARVNLFWLNGLPDIFNDRIRM